MSEPDRHFQDRIREAVEKGGPAAAFELLSGIGFAIEREPEAGIGMRMRFGAGTEDAFTTTMYAATSERPSGWPTDIPFLPGVGGALTLFDRPGRGLSVQWWKVPDPSAAAQRILSESLAAGWHQQDVAEPVSPSRLPGWHTVVLERNEIKRVLSSVTVKELSFVQLLEGQQGESCAVPPAPPPGF